MSRPNWIIFPLILLQSGVAVAWDPFTLASGAKTLSDMAGGALGGGLDDFADAGIALGDLLVDLDVDPTADQESAEILQRLDGLRKTINETRSTKAEVDHLLDFEQMKAKSHAEKIRHIQKMVQVSRKIAGLFGVRSKAAEKANQLQQTQLNYLILEEMMAARRFRFRAFIEDQERQIRHKATLEKIRDEEKGQNETTWSEFRLRRKS